MRTIKFSGFNNSSQQARLRLIAFFIGASLFLPSLAQAQYGSPGAPYTQTTNLDNCTSSSVSLNTMAINQFYLYSASGVSVLYAGGVNSPNTGNIPLQSVPPANATIVQAYLEVVEQGPSLICNSAAVSFGGALTAPGTQVGRGNLENSWVDPRFGNDAMGGNENLFFCDVRYDVTSLVSPGTASYSTNAAGVMENLVIVYTVPSPASCGSVALGDGLFIWHGSSILEWGVTPWIATLDWSCQHNKACAANQFSRWGGTSVPANPINFTDQFFGTTTPDPAQPPVADLGGGAIFQDSSTINDTFLDTYNNVPLSSPAGKITWALGNPLSGQKSFFYVNLLAASCNSVCATATPTSTPTSTNTGTSTFTPTITFTPTFSFTFTSSSTPTNSPTATPSATPTNTSTSTNSFTVTPTSTPTNSPTLTPTSTPSDTPTSTPTNTDSPTITFTFTNTFTFTHSFTPTATATPTNTPTPSNTPTNSPTLTATSTATYTPTSTFSFTSSFTTSPTMTFTPTLSFTPTWTGTATFTPSNTSTSTPSFTPTLTPTFTYSSTSTFTASTTSTFTPTITSTSTVTRTPTSTPVPTATFPPDCDEFFISRNSFCPSQEAVSLHVAYCNNRGQYSLRLYNSAGEHIKTLDEKMLTGSFQASYKWDGTNKYGDSCASGVYIFYLVEPFHKRVKRVLLVR